MTQELAELRARVARLERRWTLGWVVAILAVATVGAGSQVDRESVTAQEFVVVHPESGQRRAVLELDDLGPSLHLFTEAGTEVVHLGVTPDGTTLASIDRMGEREDVFNPKLIWSVRH